MPGLLSMEFEAFALRTGCEMALTFGLYLRDLNSFLDVCY